MSIGLQRNHTSTLPLPYPLSRHVDRCPSPTPSHSSSIYSQATSVDSIGDIQRINQNRPMYDSSSSLDDRMKGDWSGMNGHAESSPRASPVDDRIAAQNNHEKSVVAKGKEPEVTRKFPEEEDEEILKESNSRFVLFPIRYREVSFSCHYWTVLRVN